VATNDALVAAVLMGKLGNQLFQFAAVKGLQDDPEAPAAVDARLHTIWGRPLDQVLQPGSLRELTSRELLALRQVPRVSAGQRTLVKLRDCLVRTPPRRMSQQGFGPPKSYLDRSAWALGALVPQRSATRFQFDERDAIGFDPRFRSVTPPVLLRGFFQSEEYFAERRAHVSSAFKAPSRRAAEVAREVEARCADPRQLVAVSFRAGRDYLDHALPWAYFRKAAEMAADALGSPSFVVFGDTPENAEMVMRELGDYGPTTNLVGETAATQLGVMQLLPHVVVCNSTFAWWGAWLGDLRHDLDSSRLVIAPSPWMQRDDAIVPPRWSTVSRDGSDPRVDHAVPE
jgi:hypothetical protein